MLAIVKREYLNEEAGFVGSMSLSFEPGTGEIQSFSTGFWSVRQAEKFIADWTSIIHGIHAANRRVFAFVDLASGSVQKPEVADMIASAASGLYRHGDAIAMIVPTSLAKMQLRRVTDAEIHGLFISREAAETWLQAKRLSGAS